MADLRSCTNLLTFSADCSAKKVKKNDTVIFTKGKNHHYHLNVKYFYSAHFTFRLLLFFLLRNPLPSLANFYGLMLCLEQSSGVLIWCFECWLRKRQGDTAKLWCVLPQCFTLCFFPSPRIVLGGLRTGTALNWMPATGTLGKTCNQHPIFTTTTTITSCWATHVMSRDGMRIWDST